MRLLTIFRTGILVTGCCLGLSAATTLTECPANTVAGSAYTGCNFAIIANSNGTFTTLVDTTQPFFGGEDNYAGFLNNTSHTISSVNINGQGTAIFGFDGDGPALFPGTTGYEGPDNTFGNISTDLTIGTVFFTTPIAPGASTYFFLEEAINPTTPPIAGSPEPASVALLGSGILGIGLAAIRRRRAAK
jgi:hypothetical protein